MYTYAEDITSIAVNSRGTAKERRNGDAKKREEKMEKTKRKKRDTDGDE